MAGLFMAASAFFNFGPCFSISLPVGNYNMEVMAKAGITEIDQLPQTRRPTKSSSRVFRTRTQPKSPPCASCLCRKIRP